MSTNRERRSGCASSAGGGAAGARTGAGIGRGAEDWGEGGAGALSIRVNSPGPAGRAAAGGAGRAGVAAAGGGGVGESMPPAMSWVNSPACLGCAGRADGAGGPNAGTDELSGVPLKAAR
jgi:hypothetical protein